MKNNFRSRWFSAILIQNGDGPEMIEKYPVYMRMGSGIRALQLEAHTLFSQGKERNKPGGENHSFILPSFPVKPLQGAFTHMDTGRVLLFLQVVWFAALLKHSLKPESSEVTIIGINTACHLSVTHTLSFIL